jgi:hypothetical protein
VQELEVKAFADAFLSRSRTGAVLVTNAVRAGQGTAANERPPQVKA